MVVKGEGGERYTLNSKKKRTYRTYTDYKIGNGKYIARILDRKNRNASVEYEIAQAVRNGLYYEDERPLNLLYLGKKFAGFLYEGNEDSLETTDDSYEYAVLEKNESGKNNQLLSGTGDGEQVYPIGVQVVVAVMMTVIGKVLVYPILMGFVNENQGATVIDMLYYLDYKGVPAIIAGLAAQIAVFVSFKDRMGNVIYSGLIAVLVNLAGIVLWTLIVVLLMMIVQGAVNFIMEYLVYIILIAGALIWLKKKFRIR